MASWHLGLHLASRVIGVGVIVACTTKIKRVVAFGVKPLGRIGVARPFAEVLRKLTWVICPIGPVVCSVRMVVSARDPLVAWPLPLRHDEWRKQHEWAHGELGLAAPSTQPGAALLPLNGVCVVMFSATRAQGVTVRDKRAILCA